MWGNIGMDNWNDVDEVCNYCGQVTKKARGLNKQNLKRLFSFKPTINDLITLFMIIMVIFAAYSYNDDLKRLKKFYNENCWDRNTSLINFCPTSQNLSHQFNLTSLIPIPNVSIGKG